ncbi:toxin VasX [Pseudomonas batumici]|uniref:Toxin VasX N-terminal region domain-containing protein n=1 Tax=Pseudomonas batumici TaxID=226910 RepID=A0A0C2EFX2_9PSED|nr:toxin VasX [Pseudomonas batumici]KIH84939.1 hypothetical protein UCMB321_1267 [Pseudomonas batumici]
MSKYTFKPAGCPLLAAVFPLRYAIGPSLPLDLSGHGVAPLSGNFPALGEGSENTSSRPMHYTARLLRDGWLYVWQTNINMMIEFQVTGALLKETARGGSVIDPRHKPFFMLSAGAPAMMVWSPIRWSDAQFETAQTDPAMRERVMRTFTPGMAPMSGLVRDIHESIGDYMDLDGYGWSQDPVSQPPDWLKTLDDMKACEFQTYAVVDDTWGVLQDLARLLQVQMAAFEDRRKERSDDWAIAELIRSLSENDKQIRKVLPDATRYHLLERTWKEHDNETHGYEADLRYISLLWGAWFNTLSLKSPATLATACGHFDITQPAALEALGEEFARACTGASSTSFGVKTLSKALDPEEATEKPWLIWAVLGLPNQPGLSEIKRLIDMSDAFVDNAEALLKLGTRLAHALNISRTFNKSADHLAQHNPIPASEQLFTALSPVFAVQLRKSEESANNVARLYMGAALSRSQQRIDLVAATPKQIALWLSSLMETQSTAPPKSPPLKPVIGLGQEMLPFFHLVPVSQLNITGKNLPSLVDLARPEGDLTSLLKMGRDIINEAPLKCLVLVIAGLSFALAVKDLMSNSSTKNAFNVLGGFVGIFAAGTAIAQKASEIQWAAASKATEKKAHGAQKILLEALTRGSTVALINSAVAAIDVIIFGLETLEAYKAGDLDTATINLGLSSASATNVVIYVKAFRAVRAARAASAMGNALAAAQAISRANHLFCWAIALTIIIVSGVIARLYTTDTPLEKWLKNNRFGIRPETWENDYEKSMTELYKALFPIHIEACRVNEIHPYNGPIYSTYLFLHLPGEHKLRDETIRFEGAEIWGGSYDSKKYRQPVLWTGDDFQAHIGTRTPLTKGLNTYRRVYHKNQLGLELNEIQGRLFYSPMDGLTLPAIDIEELAWI